MKTADSIIRRCAVLIAAFCVLFASGCTDNAPSAAERSGFLFDTFVSVKLWSDDDAESLLDEAFELCEHYDRLFDRHNPDSDIGRINASAGATCEVSPDTAALISMALEYAELSDGRFDITCGRVTSLWDFTAEEPVLPDPQQLEQALSTVNWRSVELNGFTVRLPEDTQLDAGGIAKGYIADRVADFLAQNSVENAVINLGGNVRVLGDKFGQGFSVGIQSPFDEGEYSGILQVADCSVVTAGSYQRCFELDGSHYHHILDLSDGMSADTGLAAVTVIAPESARADALATICFLMGAEDGISLIRSLDGVEAVFLTDDGQLLPTEGAEELFRP